MEVKLVGLTKEFDKQGKKKRGQAPEKVVAVDHIDITIPDGKLIGLLGPSGCGKSTTLYMIAGLHKPSDGHIYFGEREVTNLPPEKRGIGLVFQNYALYPHLTVEENIMFPLLSRGEKKAEAKPKALEMAKLVGIDGLMDRKPSQMSGGQQQRVAIARALVKMPEVLLLDEPLSNLDARLRLQTREEIKRIQRKTNITTIFVTHDQEEAMSISDEIVVMNFGVVNQIGKPQDVYNEPVNEFVAKFLGTPPINIIEGYYDGEDIYFGNEKYVEEFDKTKLNLAYEEYVNGLNSKEEVKDDVTTDETTEDGVVEVKTETIETPVENTEAKEETKEVVSTEAEKVLLPIHVGIRPEFFTITEDGNYSMNVEMVEYIGRDKTVIFHLDGIEDKTFKAVVPSTTAVEVGNTYKFAMSKSFLFIASDGRRVK